MGFSVEQAARLYGLSLNDYGRGRGVLLSSGCGLMLAVMDQAPFRWCVDTDRLTRAQLGRLGDFAALAAAAGPLAVCGWFSYSDPAPLLAAARAVAPALVYSGHVSLVQGAAPDVGAFVDACRAALLGPVAAYSAPYSQTAGQ